MDIYDFAESGTTETLAPPSDIYDFAEQAGQAKEPADIYDFAEQGGQVPDMGAAKAFGRQATLGVAPTLAGLAAAPSGAWAGAQIGLLTGPYAPVVSPILAVVGGLAAALGVGYGTQKLQQVGMEEFLGPERMRQFEAETEVARQQHPVATFAGEVAPMLLTGKVKPQNFKKAYDFLKAIPAAEGKEAVGKFISSRPADFQTTLNMVFGSGTMAGQEAFRQVQEGDFSPLRLMANLVVGASISEPTKLGAKLMRIKTPESAAAKVKSLEDIRTQAEAEGKTVYEVMQEPEPVPGVEAKPVEPVAPVPEVKPTEPIISPASEPVKTSLETIPTAKAIEEPVSTAPTTQPAGETIKPVIPVAEQIKAEVQQADAILKSKPIAVTKTKAENPVLDAVKELGGIKMYSKRPDGTIPWQEEFRVLPKSARKSTGKFIDNMLDAVQERYPGLLKPDATVNDLLEAVRGNRKVMSEDAYFENQAKEQATWVKKSQPVTLDKMKTGSEFKIKNESFKVVEEGDAALKVKDGTEYWIPYDEGYVRVDKGSFVSAEKVATRERITAKKTPAIKEAEAFAEKAKAKKAESFKLESVTKEQIATERQKTAEKQMMTELQAKKIVGKTVDTTGDMFDIDKAAAPLFATKPAKPLPEATQTFKTKTWKSDKEFTKDYKKNRNKLVDESPDEYLQRKFCEGK